MVQKYQSPLRVYKYPFELVMAAYDRRFPTCKLIPVFLGSDITSETLSEDGAVHVVERRCRLLVDAPYILKKIAGVDQVIFIQKNSLDRRSRTLQIDAHNESFSSRVTINEHCCYSVHPDNPDWTCFQQDASLEVRSFFGFENAVEKLAMKQYSANIKKGKEIIEHFISELLKEGIQYIPPWQATGPYANMAAASSSASNCSSEVASGVTPPCTPASTSDGFDTNLELVACCLEDLNVTEKAMTESKGQQRKQMEKQPSFERTVSAPRLDADYIERELGLMNPLQESTLIQLRKWLADTHKGKIPKDSHVVRFLKARDFNIEKAREMLVHALAWRKLHAIDRLLQTYNVPEIIRNYFPGGWHHCDKDGRPMFIIRLGQTDVKGLIKAVGEEGIVRHIVAVEEEGLSRMESATASFGRAVSSCTCVVDLEGLSMRHLWRQGVRCFRRVMAIMEANYPETMGRLIIVRAPKVFPILWTVVSPFIDENTRRKFVICSDIHDLAEFVDTENLPDFLGGDCHCDIPPARIVPRTCYVYNTGDVEREQEKSPADDPSVFGNSLYQTAYVAKDFPHEVLIQVLQKGSVITWDFDVVKGDVTFTIYRCRQSLASEPHHEHRVSGAVGGIGSHQYITKGMSVGLDLTTCVQPCICRDGDSIQGSHVATQSGSYVVQWSHFDPSHSFDLLSTHKSKVIYYSEVIGPEQVRGSMTSLQSSASNMSSNRSLCGSSLQSR